MNNDLISRSALKKAIYEIWWVNKYDLDKIVEIIDVVQICGKAVRNDEL